jgi:hypothetical protein
MVTIQPGAEAGEAAKGKPRIRSVELSEHVARALVDAVAAGEGSAAREAKRAESQVRGR